MGTFVARRLLQTLLILFGLSIFFFVLLHIAPGGPCNSLQTVGATLAQQQRYHGCITHLGLDQPIFVQYLKWAGNVAHGDFGLSIGQGRPVSDEILERVPATLLLGGLSYLVAECIAIPLGIFAALRRYSFFDTLFTVLSYIGLSMPSFWLSGILILIFAVWAGWLPAGGIVGDTANIPTFNGVGYWAYFGGHPWHAGVDLLRHLVLPASVLAIIQVANDSRFMRASMLEVINQDYIRTARAKGLKRRTVVLKHALRNALLPIITNVAINLPLLISGAIITETIFAWPGIGRLFFTALGAQDYPLLQALLMISALGVLLGNLLGDLTYAWVDPRIRYD
jgi:peptide/nickel transport system permease protein